MTNPSAPKQASAGHPAAYATRQAALETRVADAAKVLQEQGIRPTVTRIRAALGGGSPNDIAPALKHWRDSILPTLPAHLRNASNEKAKTTSPPQIADLVHELWQRATAAALVEVRGGASARQVAARTEEAQSLRTQLATLRDQFQRDALAYGELRARAARYEVMAREALARGEASEARERNLLRDLGAAQQRIAELEAMAEQRAHPRNSRGHAPVTRKTTRPPQKKLPAALSKTPTKLRKKTPAQRIRSMRQKRSRRPNR
jgi:Plasmid replication region DNA-binding N-term